MPSSSFCSTTRRRVAGAAVRDHISRPGVHLGRRSAHSGRLEHWTYWLGMGLPACLRSPMAYSKCRRACWATARGPRRMLTRIVLWWSVFTALTGAVTSFVPLLMARFLFGAGEAGGLSRSVGSSRLGGFHPPAGQPCLESCSWPSQIGGALAPLIVVPLQVHYGWRMSLLCICGAGCHLGSRLAHVVSRRPHPAPKTRQNRSSPALPVLR